MVQDYIKAKTELGCLVGLLPRSSLPLVHISPIGLVPKSQANQWHMVVDLLSPLYHSVNDGISSELSSVSYASVGDAIGHILCLGRRTQLVKIDLMNAYCIVPIHPQDTTWSAPCNRIYIKCYQQRYPLDKNPVETSCIDGVGTNFTTTKEKFLTDRQTNRWTE